MLKIQDSGGRHLSLITSQNSSLLSVEDMERGHEASLDLTKAMAVKLGVALLEWALDQKKQGA